MAKNKKQPSVKTNDLKPKDDPKGGALYLKYNDATGQTRTPKRRSVGRHAHEINLKRGID